ncbi:Phosphatidylinositol 3,5-bisphosphate-binding protein [Rhodotorula kratochvilovae]
MALHLPAHSLSDAPPSPVTGVHLNASGTLFATSTVEGWVVYRTQPLEVVTRRDLPNASLRIVLPLERSNLLFLVGGPPSPLYPPNKVVLWDDRARAPVAELEFREDVRGLAARRDRLVVVLRRRVIVFVLGQGGAGIWREGGYETTDNPKGLVALASAPGATLLAFPGRQPGQVQLVHLPPLDPSSPPLPPPPSHDPLASPYPSVSVLLAHESALSALATTPDGRVLATSSAKGTLVRVWDARGSFLLRELRRGTDSAEIFGVALSGDGSRVAVSSDKGTVHCWDLRREERDRAEGGSESGASTPRQKQFSLLKPYLPKYFSSTWSHAQFRLPPPGPPASRLPFSLSNPGPYPNTPFSPAPAAGEQGGTPTVEDDVCVCAWIEVDAPDATSDDGAERYQTPTPPQGRRGSASSSSAAAPGTARPTSAEHARHSRRGSASRSAAPSELEPPALKKEAQLIALTRSGGWFRIAFSSPPAFPAASAASAKGKERAPASGRATLTPAPRAQEGVQGLGRDATSECRLVEYRRFGGTDGW